MVMGWRYLLEGRGIGMFDVTPAGTTAAHDACKDTWEGMPVGRVK